MDQKKQKMELEDLLKVKRLEKPEDAFWEKFDRELQEKTLKTFVSKPEKDTILVKWAALTMRYMLPASGAALFAILLFVFNGLGLSTIIAKGARSVATENLQVAHVAFIDAGNLLDRGERNFIKNSLKMDETDVSYFSGTRASITDEGKGVNYMAGNMSNVSKVGTLVAQSSVF